MQTYVLLNDNLINNVLGEMFAHFVLDTVESSVGNSLSNLDPATVFAVGEPVEFLNSEYVMDFSPFLLFHPSLWLYLKAVPLMDQEHLQAYS